MVGTPALCLVGALLAQGVFTARTIFTREHWELWRLRQSGSRVELSAVLTSGASGRLLAPVFPLGSQIVRSRTTCAISCPRWKIRRGEALEKESHAALSTRIVRLLAESGVRLILPVPPLADPPDGGRLTAGARDDVRRVFG